MAALDYRRRTGKGQYIDVSEYENCLHFLSPLWLDYSANGTIAKRNGNKSVSAAPHNVYASKGDDRWIAIDVTNEEEWKGFCGAIGKPSLATDPKFKDLASRKANEDELDKIVTEWTINYTPEESMEILQKAGVPAGAVRSSKYVAECPQLKHRNYWWTLPHPEMGDVVYLGHSCKLSKTPYEVKTGAPILGENTEHVCKNVIGMTEEEYVSLLLDSVFE